MQNRVVDRIIQKTQIESFIGEKPDLSHVKNFGFKIFSLFLKNEQSDMSRHEEAALQDAMEKVFVSKWVKIVE